MGITAVETGEKFPKISIAVIIKIIGIGRRSGCWFKPVHTGLKLPVEVDRQLQLGSFEHALCYLVDHEVDSTGFHACYK